MHNKPLVFRTQTCDTRILDGKKTSYSFFNEEEEEAKYLDSHVDTFDEQGAVKWFFNHYYVRDLLFEELNLNIEEYDILLEVQEPITNKGKKPGDIDILLRHKKKPMYCIAIECKRIKVVIDENGEERKNGINKALTRGVTQVNALNRMEFFKTYFMLVYLTDGRKKTVNNQVFRGAEKKTFTGILESNEFQKMSENCGLIFLEVVQNTCKNVTFNNTISVCCAREAKANMEQPSELTEKIVKVKNA